MSQSWKKEVGFVFSLRANSVWEAQLRAREANELFSHRGNADCQNVFSPSMFQEKKETMMKCFLVLGREPILRERQYFA